MKVSVIIPTYQRPAFLPEALSSVIKQDFPKDEYEILVVDNASKATPELVALCKQSTLPKIYYIHEPRTGLHNSRHAGARAAQGEILVYIDDDVLCPPKWLAAMVEPYQDQQVAMVAGKVLLHYESPPPKSLYQFSNLLSALDWGDTPHAAVPYSSPVGCNMSVRKSVLYDVGGFNPDGFGDKTLIHLRGDGECGLARKVHDVELVVWYAPSAWLEHRVSAKRMTSAYIEWRSAIAGIEEAYADLRYHHRTIPGLLIHSARSILYSVYHRLQAYLYRQNDLRRLRHLSAASRYINRARQQCRLTLSATLRQHTRQASYL